MLLDGTFIYIVYCIVHIHKLVNLKMCVTYFPPSFVCLSVDSNISSLHIMLFLWAIRAVIITHSPHLYCCTFYQYYLYSVYIIYIYQLLSCYCDWYLGAVPDAPTPVQHTLPCKCHCYDGNNHPNIICFQFLIRSWLTAKRQVSDNSYLLYCRFTWLKWPLSD